jgi:1-aminocyclopropane-1-carboxylate deaminase
MEDLLNQLNLPVPLERVKTAWASKYKLEFYVHRDDLIHPLISGNKWRKLEGILKMVKPGSQLITFGGPYSNHLIAVACIGYYRRLKTFGYVRGEGPYPENGVLSICRQLGMKLQFSSRSEYDRIKRTYGQRGSAFYIPEGGFCYEGSLGAEELYKELSSMDYIIAAMGTGTFVSGLSRAAEKSGGKSQVIGVPVIKAETFKKVDELKEMRIGSISTWDKYHYGGIARGLEQVYDLSEALWKESGIILDPIYTSKVYAAIQDKAANGFFRQKSKICMIHSGGLTGWLGMPESLLNEKAGELITGFLNIPG